MTREEEIREASHAYLDDDDFVYGEYDAFFAGAEWADAHPAWVSVEDELPKKEGRYLFYDEILGPQVSSYYDGVTLISSITHWMPRPAAPANKEGQ